MRYSHVPLTMTLIGRIESLLHDYYNKQMEDAGFPPCEYNWELYQHLASQGSLAIGQAMDGPDALAGILMYIVVPMPHHRGLSIADADTFIVHPKHRGKGVGRQLVEFMEPCVQSLGVKWIRHHHRSIYDAKPLFDGMPGYTQADVGYMKEVG